MVYRSDICEMDVRADWARMAKRSGRGCSSCSGTGTRTCSLISYIEIRRFAYDVMISLLILARDVEGRGALGIYFESMSRATVETSQLEPGKGY